MNHLFPVMYPYAGNKTDNSKQTNNEKWMLVGFPHRKVRGTNPLLLPQTPKCVTSYPKFAVVM